MTHRKIIAALLIFCLFTSTLSFTNAFSEDSISMIHTASFTWMKKSDVSVTLTAAVNAKLIVTANDTEGKQLEAVEADVSANNARQSVSAPLTVPREEIHTVTCYLLDANTLAPLCGSYTLYEDENGRFMIYDLRVEEPYVIATVTAAADCFLRIQVLSDDRSMLFRTISAQVPGESDMAEIAAALDGFTLPDSFILTAVLMSTDDIQLGNPFTTIRCTKGYREFEKQTVDDFPGRVTIDYGNGNYAVLTEGTKTADTCSRLEDGRYLLSAGNAPETGEVWLIETNEEQFPIMIASVEDNGDGTYTVTEDGDAGIANLYDVIRIDETVGGGGENEVSASSFDTQLEYLKFSDTLEYKDPRTQFSMSVSPSYTGKIHISFTYDKKWFGKDYYECLIEKEAEIEISLSLSGKFSTDALNDGKGLELVLIPETTLAGFKYLGDISGKVSLPFTAEFGGEGELSFKWKKKVGVSYNPVDGEKPIDSEDKFEPDHSSTISEKFEIRMSLKIEISANLLNGLLSVSLGPEIGCKLSGTLSELKAESSMLEALHACRLCIDASVSVFIKVTFAIECKLWKSEKLKWEILKIEPINYEAKMLDFYLSLWNDPESLFEGKITFGTGDCPNSKYLVRVQATDKNGKVLSGVPITVDKKESGSYTQTASGSTGSGQFLCYCYPGDYRASTEINGAAYTADFKITTAKKNVTISESELILSGQVTSLTDGNLTGASVSAKHPDGSIRKAITDADGFYSLMLPEGEYTVNFSMRDYQAKDLQITIKPKQLNILDASLDKEQFTVTFDGNGGAPLQSKRTVYRGEKLGAMPSASRDGYRLAGWNTNADGTGASADANGAVYADLTLYAIWQPNDCVIWNGHSYRFFDSSSPEGGITWTEARAACSAQGGHLVTITSADEQALIESMISSSSCTGCWIGGFIDGTTKTLYWITGEAVSYSNWAGGQPDYDRGLEQSVMIYKTANPYESTATNGFGTWNDLENNSANTIYRATNMGYVCEWDYIR